MNKRELKESRIAVLMGGKSSEREVSLRSGQAVLAGLLRMGYDAVGLDADHDIARRLLSERIGVAFIALHGRWGEDGVIQGLLEMLQIPYTGSGIFGSAAALDKAAMKMIFEGVKIPTPGYAVLRKGEKTPFPVPCVVKPAREGSTIGISIVRRAGDYGKALREGFKYDEKLVVEKYLDGREITVAVVNGKALPVVEVRPVSGFYDYKAKYTKGMTEYIVPAEVPDKTARRASDTALKVHEAFDLDGCSRIDMIVTRGIPYVIDINTSPGMTETSLVPKAWRQLGGDFDGLVEEILRGARLRA